MTDVSDGLVKKMLPVAQSSECCRLPVVKRLSDTSFSFFFSNFNSNTVRPIWNGMTEFSPIPISKAVTHIL